MTTHMLSFIAAAFAAVVVLQSDALAAGGGAASASKGSPIIGGNARFTVLSPTLVRMEYSPATQFLDAPSVAAINRDQWPHASFTTNERDGWLEIQTQRMAVRYKIGSGPFGVDTLRVTWRDRTGDHNWKPGDADDRNLGGVPGDMGGLTTPVTTPGPLTRNGYYILDDSHSAVWDAETQWVKPRVEKNGQDWYFFVYGRDYAHMLSELTRLIGSIPMIPRYVLGAWFGSRAGYSDEQWRMIVERFREESLPLDVVVLDSDSTTKIIWAGYDWDAEQMPDPAGFFKWMKQRGVKVTVNEHYGPLTRENDSHFEAIRKAMGLPPETQEIPHDIANKTYAELFVNLLHKPALDMGMAFWWQDGCAGANMEGLDPMMWTRRIEYEGSERITGKRGFVFCRLGTWGSHRYGAFFTGDLPGEWATLDAIVPATRQGGNMLVTYMNNLCGGVFNVDLPPELYCRWVQFGSFSPILWFHGLWGLRLPWEYGAEGMAAYRTFVGLRYALLPYTYTYARIAHETGMPLARGMYLEFPDQEPAYDHNRQYMFGRELLVAPITQPGGGKPAVKDVYLPAGDDWFDFFTGDIHRGGQSMSYTCPLERMPLFVRAGSILPMAPAMDHSDQRPVEPLTLDVYAGKAAKFRLYEDDGISLDYRKGAYAWTPISFQPGRAEGDYTVTVGPTAGTFKGQRKTRRYIVRLHGLLKPEAVMVNGKALRERDAGDCGAGWSWDSGVLVTTIRPGGVFPVGREFTVTVQNAGTFEDACTLRQVLSLRERIRRAKRDMKLKDAQVLEGGDIRKPPRVIRETEAVERQLDQLVRSPKGIGKHPPDLRAMMERVMTAVVDQPFESQRMIPEADPAARAATEKIAHASFTPEEIERIKAILEGR